MRQVIALGGGGFSMEPDNPLIDDYILKQANKVKPAICFLPTASGDQDSYITKFYQAFQSKSCHPTHLSLFEPNVDQLEDYIYSQDIVYVGGGSTRNMLVLWREWGLDTILKAAYQRGVIMAGISAGANCWFEEGLTDPLNAPLYKINGLGLIKGSICPHYEGEAKRKPAYQSLIQSGEMIEGYGVNDSTALHFINESLHHAVYSTEQAGYTKVAKQNL